MILDHISRAEKYYNVHTSFRHAFDFLKQNDGAPLKEGKHEVEGTDIYVIVSHGKPTDSVPKLENHKKYIDIQVTMDGSFPFGWRNIDRCDQPQSGYDDHHDVQLYNDQPEFKVELSKGMFAVVFPEDVHAGLPPQQHVVKAVVKVAV